jgi:hypothetical protein
MAKFFERLLLAAKKNVDTRNAAAADGPKFTFHSPEPALFSVMRQSFGRQAGVRFYRVEEQIYVEGSGGEVSELKFDGTLTLTNDGKCRLRVNDRELDEWQVLRTALEQLLFTGPTR